MACVKPLSALLRGVVAGVAGAAVQAQFFKATAKITPEAPKDAFQPPEKEQQNEMATQTVARRFAEQLAQSGPLTQEQKDLGANIVHYSFGGMWGGLYGLTAESFPWWKGPLGTAVFSSIVWMASDNVILPFFNLSAWPQAYPAKNHFYAWAAHLAYGAGLFLTFSSLRGGATLAGMAYYGARYQRRFGKYIPKPLARKAVKPIAKLFARKPVRDFVAAVV